MGIAMAAQYAVGLLVLLGIAAIFLSAHALMQRRPPIPLTEGAIMGKGNQDRDDHGSAGNKDEHLDRAILTIVDLIERELRSFPCRRRNATHIALELPRVTKRGVFMPNYELMNDQVVTITIKTTDSTGNTEPVPTGDTFSVVSSNPASLTAAIGADAAGVPAVVLTPLVQASPGLTVVVSDSAGLAQFTQIVDIVADVAPTNIVLDIADATHVAQPVPAAPGP